MKRVHGMPFEDLGAQLSDFLSQSVEKLLGFAVAPLWVVKADPFGLRLQQWPAYSNGRGIENVVGNCAALIRPQQRLALGP